MILDKVNSFYDTYLPSYARKRRDDVSYDEYDILFRTDSLYEERKKLKRVEPYYEWYYREEEEQHRPLLTYENRRSHRTAAHRGLIWHIVEPTMRYREMGDTGHVYFCRKKKKFYTKSFVRKVVRDWGYDLR